MSGRVWRGPSVPRWWVLESERPLKWISPNFELKWAQKSSLSCLCFSKGLICRTPAWWMLLFKERSLDLLEKMRKKTQIVFEKKRCPLIIVLWNRSISPIISFQYFLDCKQKWIFGIPREKSLLFYISWGFLTHLLWVSSLLLILDFPTWPGPPCFISVSNAQLEVESSLVRVFRRKLLKQIAFLPTSVPKTS